MRFVSFLVTMEKNMKMKTNKNIKKTDPIRRDHDKIGRNELCYCGSQKKYKVCHEKFDRQLR